jgi:hypothetical protein
MKEWFPGVGLFLGALIMGAGMYNVCQMISWHSSLWQGFIATGVGMIISIISFQSLYRNLFIR